MPPKSDNDGDNGQSFVCFAQTCFWLDGNLIFCTYTTVAASVTECVDQVYFYNAHPRTTMTSAHIYDHL